MKIGLIPMAAKPYHSGHDGLIRLASRENDMVKIFNSSGDRIKKGELPIYGSDMQKIWSTYIIPTLPENVTVINVPVPVRSLYETLEECEKSNCAHEFQIYSDSEDILKYTPQSLSKSAPRLYSSGKINLRGVGRNDGVTTNISGTKMRQLLQMGDINTFIKMLPYDIQSNGIEIANILLHKDPNVLESLIRVYLKIL